MIEDEQIVLLKGGSAEEAADFFSFHHFDNIGASFPLIVGH